MATTRPTNDTGAFAARPPRVNIFAKPDGAAFRPRPNGGGVFDAAAGGRADHLRDTELVAAPHGSGRARVGARLVVLAVTLIAIAVTMTVLGPGTDHRGEQSTPMLDRQPPAKDARQRAISPAAARVGAAGSRPRTRKRSKPHRATRPRRTERRQPSIPRPRMRPLAAVRPPAQPAARVVPRRDDAARSHPAPVPATAPPEFF